MPPDLGMEAAQVRPRRRKLILCTAAAIALALFVAAILLLGRWLFVEDPLEKAQAIAVLSGHMPLRAIEAAKLYRQGYAPAVWLTHSSEPGKTLGAMGIPFAGEDFYDRRILEHEGVPPEAIRVLDPPILNTADEIATISGALQQAKGSRVILVTSKVHTRRTRVLWRRLVGSRGRAIVHPASDDPFEPARWWKTSGDALDVVREVLGILNAWAGLPLRPAD